MIVYKLYSLGFANYKTELLSLYIPYTLVSSPFLSLTCPSTSPMYLL